MAIPRLSFDTSGINALADSPDFPALLAGIKVGYFTRITFLSVAETVATANPERRHKLFAVLNALRVKGECIEAHHTMLSQLVQTYEKTGASGWDSLNLHFEECEIALSRHELSDEESRQEREFEPEVEKQFTHLFADPRPKFEEVFAGGTPRPTSADELLTHLNGHGGAFWNIAAGLYERTAGRRPTEIEIRAFAEECPPFKALMLAIVHALFEWAIREKQAKKDKRVGRTDLFCSLYLPYCDIYITNDDEQRRCLIEIAGAARLPVEVISFEQFSQRYSLRAMSVAAK